MKLSDLSAGDTIVLDGGFTCCEAGEVTVHEDDLHDLYFECEHGRHYLDGQEDDDGNLVSISAPVRS